MSSLQVGVTGGIGSGKSTVCKIFSKFGVPVYHADSRAKWLMQHDADLKHRIKSAFGDNAYDPQGDINRNYLAEKVFNSTDAINVLNGLVHPAVGRDYTVWHRQLEAKYTIKEAALMFESGSFKSLDHIINVSAPEELRIYRVLKRDTFRKEKEIMAIIKKQLSESERNKRSDFHIINDESNLIIPQILELHHRFSGLHNQENKRLF